MPKSKKLANTFDIQFLKRLFKRQETFNHLLLSFVLQAHPCDTQRCLGVCVTLLTGILTWPSSSEQTVLLPKQKQGVQPRAAAADSAKVPGLHSLHWRPKTFSWRKQKTKQMHTRVSLPAAGKMLLFGRKNCCCVNYIFFFLIEKNGLSKLKKLLSLSGTDFTSSESSTLLISVSPVSFLIQERLFQFHDTGVVLKLCLCSAHRNRVWTCYIITFQRRLRFPILYLLVSSYHHDLDFRKRGLIIWSNALFPSLRKSCV